MDMFGANVNKQGGKAGRHRDGSVCIMMGAYLQSIQTEIDQNFAVAKNEG